jgi:hypothetical protein
MDLTKRSPFRKSNKSVEEQTWKGFSESELLKMLGKPTRVISGYEQVGLKAAPTTSGPCRTLIYENADGFLFIWLNDPGSGFVCFESLWFNRDVKF